ncbi:MAG: hypothetical protein GOV02_02775 [Candidatus Aenigmarchaeota archaeon]|nr:hypothetical protein [Candidatus Aenigmarchaeota archaeon]
MILVKAVIPVIICLILVSCPVLAQELFQYEVNVEIYSDLSTSYEEKFIFSEYLSESFTAPIEGHPTNIQINTDNPNHIDCKIVPKDRSTDIDCSISENIGNDPFHIFIKYSKIDQMEQISENRYQFKESIRSSVPAKNMLVLVKIPEGMGLIEKEGESESEQPFLPTTGTVGSDGRRPIIVWEKSDIVIGEGIDTSIVFEQIISTGFSDTDVILISVGLIVLVAIIGRLYYKFFVKKRAHVKVVMPILKQDEKLVVEALMKNGGKNVNQKLIVQDSNYSKAKVSKVLSSLQERGIVTLERVGRKNKVSMATEFKKKEQNDSGNS